MGMTRPIPFCFSLRGNDNFRCGTAYYLSGREKAWIATDNSKEPLYMLKILKHLRPFIASILMVIVLLFVQAMSDLALPDYTARIVNIGIQQGGVVNAVPEVIRKSQFEKLKFFMTEGERKKVEENYLLLNKEDLSPRDQANYLRDYPLLKEEPLLKLNITEQSTLGDLNQVLARAIFLLGSLEKAGAREITTGKVELAPAQMKEINQKIEDRLNTIPESIITQSAVNFIRQEYQTIGVDTDQLQSNYILNSGIKMLLIALLSAAATVSVSLISARVAAGYSRNLRQAVFSKVTDFSAAEFNQFSTASLITRSTNDIQQIQTLIVMFPRIMFYAPILAVGGVFKVLNTNTSMGWIIGVAVGAILALVVILFSIAIPKFKIVQKLVDRLNLVTREFLTGILVIRAFNNQRHEEVKFDRANQDLTRNSLFINRLMSAMMPLMMLIMNGITLLIVWVGAHQVDAGHMQVGDMMAFIQYAMQIIMAFLMISMISILLPRATVSAQRIAEVLNTEVTIANAKETKSFGTNKQGLIEFKNVSFKYPGAEDEVLSNITFRANPGETTALIGSTGSGKTTLINLLLRFYDVTKGQILIDGTDIRQVDLKELRDRIGYVPQRAVLFSGTIESNILYGPRNASEQQLNKFAAIAQANEFITALPKGFQAEISQGGTNVSGGQRQRLAIARALVKEPDIYLFDDSFSALDYKTDVALRKALGAEIGESTVLLVAQRISTILHAEKIIVLDEGKIVGMGKHDELMKTCEVYQQIAFSQLPKGDLVS